MNGPERTASDRSGLVIVLCCLAAVFEGIDLQAPGLTLPIIGPLFHMTSGDKGVFLSISTFGMILGAAIGGRLSDLVGRKAVLIAAISLFGVLTLGTALSTSVNMLLTTRFLTGLGLGGALPNLVVLITENTRAERRSSAVGIMYASLPAGGALSSLVTAIASRVDQWPIVYLIGGIAPLALVPFLVVALKNRRPTATATPTRTPADAQVKVPSATFFEALFGEGRASRTALLWSSFLLALLTMYLLLGWLPTLMGSRGLARPQASLVQLAFNACGAAGSILTGFILDRANRRVVVPVVFAAALGAIAFLIGAPPAFAWALAGGGLVGAAVSGTQALLYAMAPNCYPSRVRGTGVGFAIAVGRLGSALGPLLAAALVALGSSPTQVLSSLIPLLAVSGICATLLVRGGRLDGAR